MTAKAQQSTKASDVQPCNFHDPFPIMNTSLQHAEIIWQKPKEWNDGLAGPVE